MTSSDLVQSSWRKPSYATEVPAAVLAPAHCKQSYLLSWVDLDFGKPKLGSELDKKITWGGNSQEWILQAGLLGERR